MRQILFSPQVTSTLKFESRPEDKARHQIFPDIRDFLQLTEGLINDLSFGYKMVESLMAYRVFGLPEAKTPKQIYSDQCAVRKESENGKEWYERTKVFKNLFRVNLSFSRFMKAVHECIDSGAPVPDVAKRWDVSVYELELMVTWYHNYGSLAYGQKAPNPAIWIQVIDEEERFKRLEPLFKQHAAYQFRGPKFSYLINFYECQDSLVQHIMPVAWQAVLATAHRPEVESLKMGKQLINTCMHHVAREITESMNKQEYDAESDTNIAVELPLFANPEIDEGKHPSLAVENDEYRESEVTMTLQKVLNMEERHLVDVLTGVEVNDEFERFAVNVPSRRLAAFQFFKVDPSALRVKFSVLRV
jgi:hypothetical protein